MYDEDIDGAFCRVSKQAANWVLELLNSKDDLVQATGVTIDKVQLQENVGEGTFLVDFRGGGTRGARGATAPPK